MAGLRVVTSNLLVDRARPEAVAGMIDDVAPDVLAVQELGESNAEAVGAALPHGHLAPRSDGFGLGIAAHRPISVERIEMEERPGWLAILEAPVWDLPTSVAVVNVHLTNPVNLPWTQSLRRRRDQIATITGVVRSLDIPYVIVGDMNTTPRWPEYRMLAALGEDVALATGTTAPTWNHFTRGPRLIRIDHGFASGMRPMGTRTIRVPGTDHRALMIDLEV